jgi:hypothetical protein
VTGRALRCLGGTAQAAWEFRECLGFEFGHDTATGFGVLLRVICADVCPDYAQFGVGFSERVSEMECDCLGLNKFFSPGWSTYAGCAPSSPELPTGSTTLTFGKDFTASAISGAGAGQDAIRVDGGVDGPRMAGLGFPQGVQLTAADGLPVRSVEDAKHLLERLPKELPASVLLLRREGGSAPRSVELHFVTRAFEDELARVLAETRFNELKTGSSPCLRGPNRIQSPSTSVAYDPKCADDTTARLERVADAIRRAARNSTHRRVIPSQSRAECKQLASLPTPIDFLTENGVVELRYVDWMVR